MGRFTVLWVLESSPGAPPPGVRGHLRLAPAGARGYPLPMSRALLNELKARQIAFLEARLVSEAAARDFRERLPAGVAALLATPLGELNDAGDRKSVV